MRLKTIALSLFYILNISCSQDFQSVQNLQTYNYSINTIVGKVEFPETKFKIKADIEDIAYNATVSLIYPDDNETIATTLTSNNGSFSIDTGNYTPQTGDILILEALRRIGSSGNNIMSLRTNIKWTGSQWESITIPSIYINSKTTAICIIEANDENILADDTIGKIDYSVNPSIITNIGISPNIITSSEINNVSDLVISSLSNNNDPFSNIIRSPINKYFIDYSETIGNLIQTGECEECILTNSNLSDLNLKGFNLSGSDFSDSEFIASYMINTDLSNTNLTNTRLVKADLTNANLEGAILNGTDFTGADLSDAIWIDGIPFTGTKICGANSIDICN